MTSTHHRLLNNRALALANAGNVEEAKKIFQSLIVSNSDYSLPLLNLGNLLRDEGKLLEAADLYQRCIVIDKAELRAVVNLGNTFLDLGLFDRAEECFVYALQNDRQMYAALANLFVLRTTNNTMFPLWQELCPNLNHLPDDNVRIAILTAGITMGLNIDQSLVSLRELVDKNRNPQHISAYLYCLNYGSAISPNAWFDEYRYFAGSTPFEVENSGIYHKMSRPKDKSAKVKIGLVSADFKSHSVMHYLTGFLDSLDKDRFDVFCFSNGAVTDFKTTEIRDKVDAFIGINNLSATRQADLVRSSDVDFLIDLSGHTRGNALEMFSKRPGRIQATWIGFGSTTGLSTIDYYIGDAVTSPQDKAEFFSEKILQVNGTIPYCAPFNIREKSSESRNGRVTFGSLVRPIRINDQVLKTWIHILKETKYLNSQLILDQKLFNDSGFRTEFIKRFKLLGGEESQLELRWSGTDYWATYDDIDIALDTFPHNGGTTTDEALMSGVPVVTLRGFRPFERLASARLTEIGLVDLIANDVASYTTMCIDLAKDERRRRKISADISAHYAKRRNSNEYFQDLQGKIQDLVHEQRASIRNRD